MKLVRVFIVLSVLVAALFMLAGSASANNDNTGCGAGFFKSSDTDLATQMSTDYVITYNDALAYLQSVDKNGDHNLCWKYIGATCPCTGNKAINVVDNASNATQT